MIGRVSGLCFPAYIRLLASSNGAATELKAQSQKITHKCPQAFPMATRVRASPTCLITPVPSTHQIDENQHRLSPRSILMALKQTVEFSPPKGNKGFRVVAKFSTIAF